MPTIIDSLIVKLGLDTSDYDKGRKKVGGTLKDTGKEAKEMGKKVKEGAKEGAGGFAEIAKEATKFLAIIGGTAAITSFTRDVIESSASLQRFSMNIGRTVEEVSRLSGAAEIAGGSAEGLQGTLDMLSKSQTELLLTGNNSLLPFFSALGISAQEATGSVTDLLLVIREKMKERGIDRQTGANMGQMFGIDAGTMNLLLSSDDEFKEILAFQAKLNKLTGDQAKQFVALQKSLKMLGQETDAYGISLVSKAAPAIQEIIDLFREFGEWVNEHEGFVIGFLGTLAGYLLVVGAASIPISLLAAELLILAGIIGLVYDDYKTFKAGGDSAMPWDYWIPKIETAVEWLKNLKTAIADIAPEKLYNFFTKVFGLADSFVGAVMGDEKRMRIAYQAGSGSYSPSAKPTAVASTPGNDALAVKMANAEAAAGLPPGTLAAIRKQETGNNAAYINDPTKYHYGLDANGRRIAGHTGKISTAFGPFGILESTARDPGYGVAPLKDKSLDEQIRFAAEYAAARARSSGSLAGGLAGYGEGGKYARSVMAGIPGASNAAIGAGASPVVAGGRTVSTTVGEVKVYTQATDADGIARDMAQALDYLSVAQANYGQM